MVACPRLSLLLATNCTALLQRRQFRRLQQEEEDTLSDGGQAPRE